MGKNFVGQFFVVEVDYPKACADDGILAKYVFAIKALERSKLLGVYFHSLQSN